jgi:hypothetical protein
MYHEDERVKRDEMGGACGTYGDRRKAHTIFRKDQRARDRSADPGEFGE